MSITENINRRISYLGGKTEGRVIKGKLDTLKKALTEADQGETITLEDGREFRCLINPDKETGDYDNKILSIPYSNIRYDEAMGWIADCSDYQEDIGVNCGDVIYWNRTDTHWLVWLEALEEKGYFRAQIRKCDQEVEVGGKRYWAYIRGPLESSIQWNQKAGIEWNDLNYSMVLYITRDANTISNLHRFSLIKVEEPKTGLLKTWQTVSVNPYFGDGIIAVYLDEYFENSIKEQAEAMKPVIEINPPVIEGDPHIVGNEETFAFTFEKYKIDDNHSDLQGSWFVNYGRGEIYLKDGPEVELEINKKSGYFTIIYRYADGAITKKVIVSAI